MNLSLKTIILQAVGVTEADCHSIELNENGAAVTALSTLPEPTCDVSAGARISSSNWPPPRITCSWAQIIEECTNDTTRAYVFGARDALRFRNT